MRICRVAVRSAAALILLLAGGAWTVRAADPELTAKLDRLVRPFIDSGLAVGLVIGVLDAEGPRVFGYGRLHEGSKQVPDGDTVFEIGSITKVFTATVLQGMVEKQQVELDEPVQKLLPRSVQVPRRGDREITLVDLATHVSGLPRMPGNLRPKKPENPYADYTVKQLYTFLGDYELVRLPGKEYEYSNLGAGLLGHGLALKAGMSYEKLVVSRVCDPCGLKSTRIQLDEVLRRRWAPGHDQDGMPAPSWTFDVCAPAGALRSTANDMLRFAAANLGLVETPLRATLEATHQLREDKAGVALGWHLTPCRRALFHNGGTGGYRSYLGFDKEKRVAVIALANSALEELDLIGLAVLELLRGEEPKPLAVRWPARIASKQLDACVGAYTLAPQATITVTRDGDKLFAQLTGQPRARLYPEGAEKFFYRIVDAQITFEKDAKGKVTGLILHQNGQDMPAKRVK